MNAIHSTEFVPSVARAEDLPYWSSPPIQFVYESIAPLVLGQYTWADGPSALTPDRPIIANALYYFRHVTLAADVSELDFTSNLTATPQFRTFLRGDSRAVLFREPIQMNMFYEQFDYRFFWASKQLEEQLLAGFVGSMIQGAALIGKNSITLKATISAQEIVDEHYIELFRANYPEPAANARVFTDGRVGNG